MTLDGWLTIGTLVLVVAGLMSNRISADVAMLGGLTVLMLLTSLIPGVNIIDPSDGVSGFAEHAVIMIGAIYIVAAGLSETGAVEMIAQAVLGRPKTLVAAQFRMMLPVSLMSAFMNTTTVVAMYMPIVADWSRKMKFSSSRLYMPLSFAAILGGTCTLIGTSSNMTITGLYTTWIENHPDEVKRFHLEDPEFWWISTIGVPSAIVGVVYVLICSRWLLPERRPASQVMLEDRKYKVEMRVEPTSPIVGKTIEEAGLRHLPGLYLAEIERESDVIPAVGPDERIQANDLLVFVGIVESVVDLRRIRGLIPATTQVKKVRSGRRQRTLVEAVVSGNSPLIGRSVRQCQFRTQFNAAIIAVHRGGMSVTRKIGDIVLQPGDTLLLETHVGFVNAYRNSSQFYLVSQVEGAREVRHERAWLSMAILGLFVVMLALTPIDRMVSALVCAGLMVGTRCCTGTIARQSINWQVLIVIGAAIGIGRAMENTKVAHTVAEGVIQVCAPFGPYALLTAVYFLTLLIAQLVSNNGAAVLMFPIAMSVAIEANVSPVPFLLCLMSSAACNFVTPMAYQTNLMVYGPGGYKFADYTRFGAPLNLAVGVVAVTLSPFFFPFHPTA